MAGGRRCGFARRRLLHHRRRGCGAGGAHALQFARGDGFSGMRGQSLLLFCKRDRRGRRRFLGDHLPVHDCRGRRGYAASGRSFRSEHTFTRRSYSYPRIYRRAAELLLVHCNRRPGHRLRSGEGTLRDDRYRAPNVPVRIGHVRDGRALIDDGGVVNVRDHGSIDDRVAYIHARHIAAADLVWRYIHFTRTEREPAHVAAETAWAAANDIATSRTSQGTS